MTWTAIASKHWTTTLFKGRHTMTCMIEHNGVVLACAVRGVRVAAGAGW